MKRSRDSIRDRGRTRRLALLVMAAAPLAAQRWAEAAGSKYYVAPGPAYNWNSTADWSVTLNGSSGAPVPVAGDSVFITHTDNINRVITYDYSGAGVSLAALTIDQNNHNQATTNTDTLLMNLTFALTVTGNENIGYVGVNNNNGTGVINQTAGSNNLSSAGSVLYLGYDLTDTGTYNLGGGTLTCAGQELLGLFGTGVVIQNGGSNTITGSSLGLGVQTGSTGIYTLGGTGILSSTLHENIGQSGVGLFNQSGGSNTVNTLGVGGTSTGTGTYTLTGGSLSITNASDIGSSGIGYLNQSGGTNNTSSMILSLASTATGSYTLNGNGVLNVSFSEDIGQVGHAFFNQSGTSIHTVGTFFTLGDQATAAATYTLSGTASLTTSMGETVGNAGTGYFNQSGGTNNISGAVLYLASGAGSAGTYTLSGTGSLSVATQEFIGALGVGTFNQTGGTNTVGSIVSSQYIVLGEAAAGVGTYLLSGGTSSLQVYGNEGIGLSSGSSVGAIITQYGGTFNQSNGNNTVTGFLTVGQNPGSTGLYLLSGGTLQVGLTGALISNGTYIGSSGTGAFIQSGGTANEASLSLGQYQGSIGTYSLASGAMLTVDGPETIGVSGKGVFNQSGGSHTATSITLAAAAQSNGQFMLSGGSVNLNGALSVGQAGTGTFNQTGGLLTAAEIDLGAQPGGSGSLTLQGGTTVVGGNLYVGGSSAGAGGSGRLNVTGTAALSITGTLQTNSTVLGNGFTISSGANVSAGSITLIGGKNFIQAGGVLVDNGLLVFSGFPAASLTITADPSSPGELVLHGDVISNASSGTVNISVTGSGLPALVDLGGTTRVFNVSQGTVAVGLRIAATMTDGSFVKAGAGTLLLAGTNTFTGTATITGGTLQIGALNAIEGTSSVLVQNGGTLDLGGFSIGPKPVTLNGLGAGSGGALIDSFPNTGSILGPLTFASAASIGGASNIVVSGPVIGSGTLVKTGTSTVTLSGGGTLSGGINLLAGVLAITASNSFTGGVVLNGGTLAVDQDSELGSASNNLTLSAGGTLEALATFSSNRGFNASGGSISVNSGQTLTLAGVGLTGTGTFISTGAGVLRLTGSNPFTGAVQVGGNISLSGSTGGLPGVSSIDIQPGGVLELNSSLSGNHVLQDRINDNAPVALDGGTLSLVGVDSGATTETLGQLTPASSASAVMVTSGNGGTAALTFTSLGSRAAGATVDFGAQAFGGTIDPLGGNETVFITNGVSPGPLGGWATVNGTDFAKYDSVNGVVAFTSADYTVNQFNTAANVYLDPSANPPIPASIDTVSIASLNINSSAGTVVINQNAGSTLTISSGGLIASSSNPGGQSANISGGTLTSGTGDLDISLLNTQLTISSALVGSFAVTERSAGGGVLILQNSTPNNYPAFILNSGTLNLNASTVAIPGNLIINGGTVNSQASGQLAVTSIVVINGGTWNLNGFTENIAQLNNSGGTLLFEGGTLNVSSGLLLSGGTTTVASTLYSTSVIAVSGGDNEVHAGALVTTSALTFLGSNSPAVQVFSDAASPGRLVLSAGGSLSFAGTGSATLSSAGIAALAGILDLDGSTNHSMIVAPGATLVVGTQIVNGGFEVHGGGTLELTGASSYSGGTTISTGTTLMAANPAALGASGSTVTFNGGTLALRSNANVVTFPYITTVSGTSVSTDIDIDRTTPVPGLSTGTITINAMTLGSGNASLTISGNDAGVLAVGTGTATAATIQYNSASPGPEFFHTIASLTLNGPVLQSGGNVDVVKDQAGTLTFGGSGDNNFGTMSVNGGTLMLSKSSGLAIPGNLNISGGSTVRFAASNQINPTSSITLNAATGIPLLDLNGFNNSLGNAAVGGIAFIGGGTLSTGTGVATLGSDVTLTTPTGTAAIDGNLNLGSSTRTFTIDRGSAAVDMQIAAVISGNAGLTKAGAGMLYLSGANTFVGPVTINNGVLKIDSDSNLGDPSNTVTINSGTLLSSTSLIHTVNIAGAGGILEIESINDVQISAPVGGSGGLTKTGTGTLLLSGGNSFMGGLSVNSGTLQVNADANLGASGQSVNLSGGTLMTMAPLVTAHPLGVTAAGGTINAALGMITVSGDPSWAGNLVLAAGTLNFAVTGGTAAVVGSSTLTIMPGATVMDGGSIDPLGSGPNEVNVVNNSVTSFDVTSGAKTAGLISGVGNTNISFGATLTTAGVQQSNLIVNGSLLIAKRTGAQSSSISVVNTLTIAGALGSWTGTVDLNNNDMIVHNGNLTQLNDQARSGCNAGHFNGTGITSTAAATDTTHLTAIAAVLNSNGTSVLYSTFDGQPAVITDVLLRYTYYGDTNLDGKVDGSDYSRIDNGFLHHSTGWFNGDFNYDGVVNGSDYTLIDNAYNTQGAVLTAQVADPSADATDQLAGTASVPEPATLGLITTAAAVLSTRRRMRVV